MLYLGIIYHMHQPYYKDVLTNEFTLPWVRLHGIKDYYDMVKILEDYPKVHVTFNLVPSLVEQIRDYVENNTQDTLQKVSYKRTEDLTEEDKQFILENFFKVHTENVIALHPRFYELYFKKQERENFELDDYRDLIVWYNLAYFDPYFLKEIPELRKLEAKARDFSEKDKLVVLDKQKEVLSWIMPIYKKFQDKGQIEVSVTPYFHPILPLLINTDSAKLANKETVLPKKEFKFPEDAKWHIEQAITYYKSEFGFIPKGMWPSEEAVSQEAVDLIMDSGIKWIVTDEEILFKSLNKKRKGGLLYRPWCVTKKDKSLNIVFRDKNLSDLIGFVYQNWPAQDAVNDFMRHLSNIAKHFRNRDCLVVVALDGENAWEYYRDDGWDFLSQFYEAISKSDFVKAVTISEYLQLHRVKNRLKRIIPGSWIYGNFNKWIGSPEKNAAWEKISIARETLAKTIEEKRDISRELLDKIYRHMHILEGSDWFWWYDEANADFDELFKRHLSNFYKLIEEATKT